MLSLVQSIQLWDLQRKKDLDLLKKVQRKAMKMVGGMEHNSYESVRAGAVQHGEGSRALMAPYSVSMGPRRKQRKDFPQECVVIG